MVQKLARACLKLAALGVIIAEAVLAGPRLHLVADDLITRAES